MPSWMARRWASAPVICDVDSRPRASLRRRPVSRIELILALVEALVVGVASGGVGGCCEEPGWAGLDGAISACMAETGERQGTG